MIALLDYGAGNLTSVRKAFGALEVSIFTPPTADELSRAQGVVIPGVGHFDRTRLLDDGWKRAIRDRLAQRVPILGICLGLQWLFEGSTEAADVKGLGTFPGCCDRLATSMKVPHVGWNELVICRPSRLLHGVDGGAQVYFTHSYAAPVVPQTVATTEYGVPFSAVVEHDNVAAVQFHPEKSGDVGLTILRNWIAGLKPRATGDR